MDSNLAAIVLGVVTAATALNLFLTLRLAAKLRAADAPRAPLTVRIGAPLPSVAGLTPTGEPGVIIFLSEGCPACRGKVAEIERLLPRMAEAGVRLWIVGTGDLSGLIAGTGLANHFVELAEPDLALLNPNRASPAYIFVDAAGVAQASDYLGDEDWRTFAAQMQGT